MSFPHLKIELARVLLLSLLVFCGVSGAYGQRRVTRKHPVKKQEQAAPVPAPTPAPLPPTPEQSPAVPAKVSFSNGLLTIVAENSTLDDILRAVRTKTGAAVEIPPNANERVVTHLGPGVPREVLASLLNGSHFNYVMLGSPSNPNKIDRVILTSKAGSAPDAGAAPAPAGQNAMTTVQMEEPDQQPGPDMSEQPTEDAAENSANEEGQQQPPQPNGQQQVKTPEQLLRELQQQQQLAAPPGQPPPQ